MFLLCIFTTNQVSKQNPLRSALGLRHVEQSSLAALLARSVVPPLSEAVVCTSFPPRPL